MSCVEILLKILKHQIKDIFSDKKFSEILVGSAWALSARVIATVFNLAISVIIARYYGAETMGIVAVLNAFLTIATIFTVLGTDTSILRLLPEHLVKYSPTSALTIYRKTLRMVIAVSVITGVCLFFNSNLLADNVFSKPNLSFYFALATFFIVFKSLMNLNTQAVRGIRMIRVFAFLQVLPSFSNLLFLAFLTFFLYQKDNPIYTQFASIAITGTIGWVVMKYAFRKIVKPTDIVKKIPVRDLLAISLPMLMTATMTFLIGQTGVIMLGMFRSEAEVGYYSISVKLAMLTSFILSSINTMAAPKFSELYHSSKMDELFHVAQKSAKLVFWATFPILLGLLTFGHFILEVVYGQDFVKAYPALALLVVGQFIAGVSGATSKFMNMTGLQKILRNIMIIVMIVNVSLNCILIPRFGILGAAIAAMISIVMNNASILLYIKNRFGKTTGYLPLFNKIK